MIIRLALVSALMAIMEWTVRLRTSEPNTLIINSNTWRKGWREWFNRVIALNLVAVRSGSGWMHCINVNRLSSY